MQNLSKHLFLGLFSLVVFTSYSSAQSVSTNQQKSNIVNNTVESNDDKSHQAVNYSVKTPKKNQLMENQQLVEKDDNGRKIFIVGTTKLTPEQKLLKRREEAVVLHNQHITNNPKKSKK